MLEIKRKKGQSVLIRTESGEEIEVFFLGIHNGSQARIGFKSKGSNRFSVKRSEALSNSKFEGGL